MIYIDKKYIGLISSRLEKFHKKTETLFNFRCPFCGDSHVNKSKTRGYLFAIKDSFAYKCHNCGIATSLFKFIEHIDSNLASAYKLDKFSRTSQPTIINAKEKVEETKKISNTLIDLGLIQLDRLQSSHHAIKYAESRQIPISRYSELYYAKNTKVLEALNPAYENRIYKEERLVIPFYDKLGNLSGVTARAMGNSELRYLTIRITEYPMIYGMNLIDSNKLVYVTEGAFDSMFVDNAVAVNGSDLKRAVTVFDKKQLALIFDNQPRNKQLVNTIEKMIYCGYRIMIWPNSFKYKDINEAIIAGMTQESIMKIIKKNTKIGLSLNLAIRDWKKT